MNNDIFRPTVLRERSEEGPPEGGAEPGVGLPSPSGSKLVAWPRVVGLALIFVSVMAGVILFVWQQDKRASGQPTGLVDASQRLKPQTGPLDALSKQLAQAAVSNASTLDVNGQLDVTNSLVLAPAARPAGAVAGQVYYDQTSNQIFYYNGSQFVSLAGTTQVTNNVTTINGSGVTQASLNSLIAGDTGLAKLSATQTFTGADTFADRVDSPAAFLVQDASAATVLAVDTTHHTLSVTGSANPQLPMFVIANSDGTPGLEVRTGGSGLHDDFLGVNSGKSNVSGIANVGLGENALQGLVSGADNVAVGFRALEIDTSGGANIAIGSRALLNNTASSELTAVGFQALESNTSGFNNTALGYAVLQSNTSGIENLAAGVQALTNNTSGSDNVGLGLSALSSNTLGTNNVAVGSKALQNSTASNALTAVGFEAGQAVSSGGDDTFVGFQAGAQDPNVSTFATSSTLQNATALGYGSQVQASNALVLGGQGANQVNVGIGTTSPSNLLSVSPDAYGTGTAGTGGASSINVTGVGTAWTAAMAGDELVFADGTKQIVTAVGGATNLTLASAVTEADGSSYRLQLPALQVAASGKVGVGTVSPTAQFQVTTQNNTAAAFQVQDSGGNALLNANTQDSSVLVKSATNATDAFEVQNTSGVSVLSVDATAMKVTVAALVVTANITLNGHLITGGGTPGIAAGAAACTTPSVGISGTDTSGVITVTTGTGCSASGTLATVTFANPFGAPPHVTLTPAGLSASSLAVYYDAATISGTAFELDTSATAVNSTTYKWSYLVAQ